MRGPSRQTTSRLVAGASARAATARARSATTRPSAPSATPAKRQRAAGREQFGGGLRAMLTSPSPRPRPLRLKSRSRRNSARVVVRRHVGCAGDPGEQLAVRHLDQPLELVELAVASMSPMCASAKRPMIRSISRMPRCQERNRSWRRRRSSPSLERVDPVICCPTPKARHRAGFGSSFIVAMEELPKPARLYRSVLVIARSYAKR